MLRTRFTDLFGISVPLLLAPFGPWPEALLAAEVCRAGALGSLGTATRSAGVVDGEGSIGELAQPLPLGTQLVR